MTFSETVAVGCRDNGTITGLRLAICPAIFSHEVIRDLGYTLEMRFPDKPTTPAEWSVIAWTLMIAFAGSACVAFYLTGRAETAEQVTSLRSTGFWCGGLAVGIWLLWKLVPRLVD